MAKKEKFGICPVCGERAELWNYGRGWRLVFHSSVNSFCCKGTDRLPKGVVSSRRRSRRARFPVGDFNLRGGW